MKQLIQAGSNLTYLDKKAAATIRQAIVNCFILPWPNVSNAEQEFEKRTFMLQEYISNLAQDLLNLDNSSGHGHVDKVTNDKQIIFILMFRLSNDIPHVISDRQNCFHGSSKLKRHY